MALANVFFLKKGDTYPALNTILSDENGPVNLTGASILFRMSEPDTGNIMISAAATLVSQANPVDYGKVFYTWITGDTDVSGIYRVEWVVTFPNGKKATFPRGVVEKVEDEDIFNHVIIQEIVD